jgi:Kef-type K+ transport system membrane component KefB
MLIVFGAAKLLGEIAGRLGQPAIIGEIAAGVLIGPALLSWVSPGATLEALAELGVMFLLFRVGMQVNATELWSVRGRAFVVAGLGVAVPLAAGWALMDAFGTPMMESLFGGAALVATSVGVTAQVLGSRGLLNETASQIILAAAVIDDVLGLIVLAAVSGAAGAHVDPIAVLLTSGVALGFTALVARWGPHAMRRAAPRLERWLRAPDAQFHIALILLFVLAVFAMRSGVAAIVGAFLAGLALSEAAAPRVHDLAQGIAELLTPFFLASIGLHCDFSVFRNRTAWALTGAILLLAVLTKIIGCGAGAAGLGWSNMLKVGCGMVPRGEVGMVVARYGLASGAVSGLVYSAIVFMTVATTVATPWLLRFAFGARSAAKLVPNSDTESIEWQGEIV